MNKKERKYRIRKIFNLCLEIQESGEGVNGHPMVHFDSSNYGSSLCVWIMNNGWPDGESQKYDASYYPLDSDVDYKKCVSHLKGLLRKIKEDKPCTEE